MSVLESPGNTYCTYYYLTRGRILTRCEARHHSSQRFALHYAELSRFEFATFFPMILLPRRGNNLGDVFQFCYPLNERSNEFARLIEGFYFRSMISFTFFSHT